MDVICLAFANDRANPLPTLQEEDNNLNRILSPRQFKQHYILIRDSYASITSVTNTIAQSKDQLRIFFDFNQHILDQQPRLNKTNLTELKIEYFHTLNITHYTLLNKSHKNRYRKQYRPHEKYIRQQVHHWVVDPEKNKLFDRAT